MQFIIKTDLNGEKYSDGQRQSYQTKLGKITTVEPPPDKTSKMTVRPAKTQISLGIYQVWSEFSLCAQRVAKDPSFLHADSEDSDQTEWMPRLIQIAGRTCHIVGFVMMQLSDSYWSLFYWLSAHLNTWFTE